MVIPNTQSMSKLTPRALEIIATKPYNLFTLNKETMEHMKTTELLQPSKVNNVSHPIHSHATISKT